MSDSSRTESFNIKRLDKYEPIPESGCWIYTGSWSNKGYGRFKIPNGKFALAHRFFYERHKGPISEGMMICHKCDTPPCVNPDHLFQGTASDNAMDRSRKGRNGNDSNKGVRNGRAHFTEQQVLEIRDSSESMRAIARKYGVHHRTISNIKSRKKWRHT